MEQLSLLRTGAAALNITLDDGQLQQFTVYAIRLTKPMCT